MKTATFRKQLESLYPVTLVMQRTGKTIFLHKISVQQGEKQKGVGTFIMNKIVQWCDENQFVCVLVPTDAFGSYLPRLINFYARFGFEFKKDSDEMLRIPKRLN